MAQAVPQPNWSLPLVEADFTATAAFRAFFTGLHLRTGGQADKVDAAYVTAAAAVPQSRQVIGGGGLQGADTLASNAAVSLYKAMTGVAGLPADGNATGEWAFALDGCKPGEASGSGTGVPVVWIGGDWYSAFSGAVVDA